ncbi:hypothetical protein [Kitasatospora sp. NBC_01266]|uniref:hypothetical protein n=1 Tax=Kitasatospora sp. NBC_01266 TaxID=2903572 RepID=UPI002E35CDCE|nr:hypothetical protein [Kitasatospora sp. NBC_01266]
MEIQDLCWAVVRTGIAVALAVRAYAAVRSPVGSHRGNPAFLGAAVTLASTPWLLPDDWFLPPGETIDEVSLTRIGLGLAFAVAVCTALVWPRYLVPGAAAASLLVLSWPVVRPVIVARETAAALARIGHPPRDLLLQASLSGYDADDYEYSNGAVSVGFLADDGSWNDGPVAYLEARPAAGTPCAVLMSSGGGGECRSLGNGIWHAIQSGNSSFARVEGTVLVTVHSDGPGFGTQLLALLRSAHPATDVEIVGRT